MSYQTKRMVEAGHDRVTERYLSAKRADDPVTLAAPEELTPDPPPGAAARASAWRFVVTGVDVSARQPELARRYVPAAEFVKADRRTGVDSEPETFKAVVALHSLTHLHRWLKPGGMFLMTWALVG